MEESHPSSMQRLVSLLKSKEIIRDPRVEEVMLKVDRSHYCTSRLPYDDSPYSIGYNATISAPHMHAYALEHLKDKLVDGARVLDVGSGSGYLTACMAHMVGPNGKVYGVEHIPALVRQSEANIREDCPELLDSRRVKLFVADGRAGLPSYAPFDVIHVGATAPGLPEELLKQLAIGGKMVAPIQRGEVQKFEGFQKLLDNEIRRTEYLNVRYVPLTDVKSQLNQN